MRVKISKFLAFQNIKKSSVLCFKGNIFMAFVVLCFFALLSSCWSETYTEPRIVFQPGSLKLPADSLDVGEKVNLELHCFSNGNDLLTRLCIYSNNRTNLEDMSLRPPVASFGYRLSFIKTKAETDSLIFELHDKNSNMGTYIIELYKKPEKPKKN